MQLSLKSIVDPAPLPPEECEGAGAVADENLGLVAVAWCRAQGPAAAAAAQMAIDVARAQGNRNSDLVGRLRRHPTDELRQQMVASMVDGIRRASREVFALGRRQGTGLPVSLDLVLVAGGEAFVAHVGDGRVYLCREGLVHRLTVDHVARGEDVGDPPTGPPRLGAAVEPGTDGLRLTRALGMMPSVEVETLSIEVRDGDRLLILPGPLHRDMGDAHLREVFGDHGPKKLMGRVVRQVRLAGSLVPVASAALWVGAARGDQAAARKRLAVLARMPLFAYCSEAELLSLASVTRPRSCVPGAVVVSQGQENHAIYLLVRGNAEIVKDGKVIVEIGPGSNFGEMSMLDDPRASASVRIKTAAELLVIPREAFFGMLKKDPTFAVKVLWNMLLRLSSNLRSTSTRLAELTQGVGLPPEALPPAPPLLPEDS